MSGHRAHRPHRTRGEAGRTPAEWATLVVSSLVLSVVVGLILVEMSSRVDPAEPVARVERTAPLGQRWGIYVAVTNVGDETAANVQVTATVTGAHGLNQSGELSVDFLAGDEVKELVFMVDSDPRRGDLSVVVSGFEDP